ncbi:capsular polysaccharide biosynthesis protein [Catenovulum sediminis]|uniref:Capsular polysaccharide biosynthesis protein n=1 Tax=Catenovulum sediminis TaxID=1740262 RepID=A0ABV1RKP8_9ALTE
MKLFSTPKVQQKSGVFFLNHSTDVNENALGWGLKPSAARAKVYADQHNLPFWRVEDGFIGYLNHPTAKSNLLSLSVDTTGIYYDATNPSDMEAYIAAGIPEQFSARLNLSNDEYVSSRDHRNLTARVQAFRQSLIDNQITKYNLCGQAQNAPLLERNAVLVIDQTFGDLSVEYSYASADSFKKMLQAALDENPNSTIYIKTHPDVLLGKKTGFIQTEWVKAEWLASKKVQFIYQACNPIALIQQVERVYTVCSQMGFEALLNSKHVVTFGAPFYAGWGLTDDRGKIPQRRLQLKSERGVVSIDDLVFAAYFCYVRYVHPISKKRCEPEDIAHFIQLQKGVAGNNSHHNKRFDTLYCCDFSLWKRAFLPYFLRHYAKSVKFIKSENIHNLKAKKNDGLLIWGAKPLPEKTPEHLKTNILRCEDGFVRSIGLGADLRRPASLVIDKTGIYFDPRQPSDLENILQNKVFNKTEIKRAEKLITLLVQSKVSKYNVAQVSTELDAFQPDGKKVILVVGQVEDDASIQTGCPKTKTNSSLLKQVRQQNPDAYLVYKPHPDVLSGNRTGDIPQIEVESLADLQVQTTSIIEMIELADELHTMSSLAGFEALLRGKKVHCYGMPFYAGWGLTHDDLVITRRTKKLTLAELVHGSLIDYPKYIDWESGFFTTPEQIIEGFTGKAEQFAGRSQLNTFFSRNWRKIRFIVEALTYKQTS